MPRGRPRVPKEPKRKAVALQLCPREHAGKVTEPYRIMEALIAMVRHDLADVKIGIVWHVKGWRPDADGTPTLGKAVKHGETERQRTGIDWDIQLSQPVWKALDDRGKERLVFHELEHIQICNDKNGAPMLDDKNRMVTRAKRHDVGEFRSVIERYGLPESMTEMDIADGDRPLLKLAEAVHHGDTEDAAKPPSGADRGDADEPVNEPLVIKVKGLRKTEVKGLLLYRPGEGYGYDYAAHLGNYEGDGASHGCCFETRAQCLHVLKDDLIGWLQELELTGTADRRRADGQRRQQMHEQIVAELDKLIQAAETSDEGRATSDEDGTDADEIPFEED